ncbi:MAG: Gfo/Idh/MocA family oxidoreductase [Acidimicrobiia bacterium]|nr:Gfo/Idh/MocA family oxidoreductase [Acidimicrobiia bacterium]
MPTLLPITGRPVRVAVVGLGTVSELGLVPYIGRDDVTIVGLCDRDLARLERWGAVWPDAARFTDLDEMLGIDADVIDVLVPTPFHGDVVCQILDAGYHVQVQKPLARSLEEADRMLAAAQRNGAVLRVMEDYIFFPPIAKLGEVVRSGEIGAPAGIHMKIVATGRGGWDVPDTSWQWHFEQAKDGRGMLVFDHGWHQFAVAMWLFGPIRRVFGWVGATEVAPGISMDAPSTFVWEHTNGVRGVLDITLSLDQYFRSDHYTGDERIEVTGTSGYVRCNRISAFGVQQPSVEVYKDGEIRAYHALPDTLPAGFEASTAHALQHLRGETTDLVMDGVSARAVLVALLAAVESGKTGVPVDVPLD